jgi:Adipocyte plasma membrane-associated protein-like, N-terminal
MRKLLAALGLVVVALAAYLLLWPVPVQPVAWSAPRAPGYVAPHAPNTRLAGLQAIDLGADEGPEHIIVRDGWVYAAVASGAT